MFSHKLDSALNINSDSFIDRGINATSKVCSTGSIFASIPSQGHLLFISYTQKIIGVGNRHIPVSQGQPLRVIAAAGTIVYFIWAERG